MNAGLSNLTTLKAYVLAASLRTSTDYDASLTAIGLGVAAAFENYCNRKFQRVAGQVDTFAADRTQFLLNRYPVEAPITLVEYKEDEPTGWVTQPQTSPNGTINQYRIIRSLDAATGIVYFREEVDCGGYWAQMRFTYTGGYFWETLEPTDGNYPTTMPSTATALPADLQLAWFLQCAEVWKKKDKLGQGIATDDDKVVRINPANLEEQFLPEVKSILSQYIRYSFV